MDEMSQKYVLDCRVQVKKRTIDFSKIIGIYMKKINILIAQGCHQYVRQTLTGSSLMLNFAKIFIIIFSFSYSSANAGGLQVNAFKWHDEKGYVHIDDIDVSATPQSGTGKAVLCNGLESKKEDCSIGFFLFGSTVLNPFYTTKNTLGSDTAGAAQFNNMKGKTTSTPTPANPRSGICPVYDYRGSAGSYYGAGCNGSGIPPTPPTPPPPSCSANQIEINHGVIGAAEVDGHAASETLIIQCTGEATVLLNAPSYGKDSGIAMSGPGDSISSLLTIDGKSADVGNVYIINPTKSVVIESRLKTTDKAAPGSYLGSIVLSLDIQ